MASTVPLEIISSTNFLAFPSVPVYLRLTVIDIPFSCLSPQHPVRSKKADRINIKCFMSLIICCEITKNPPYRGDTEESFVINYELLHLMFLNGLDLRSRLFTLGNRNKLLFHFSLNQSLAGSPGGTNFLADNAVFILG